MRVGRVRFRDQVFFSLFFSFFVFLFFFCTFQFSGNEGWAMTTRRRAHACGEGSTPGRSFFSLFFSLSYFTCRFSGDESWAIMTTTRAHECREVSIPGQFFFAFSSFFTSLFFLFLLCFLFFSPVIFLAKLGVMYLYSSQNPTP